MRCCGSVPHLKNDKIVEPRASDLERPLSHLLLSSLLAQVGLEARRGQGLSQGETARPCRGERGQSPEETECCQQEDK